MDLLDNNVESFRGRLQSSYDMTGSPKLCGDENSILLEDFALYNYNCEFLGGCNLTYAMWD